MGTPEVRDRIRATRVGKPLHPDTVAAQREAVRKPKPESWNRLAASRMKTVWEHAADHGLPPCHHRTDEEIALLGTANDSVIAKRLGVSKHVVESKRRR